MKYMTLLAIVLMAFAIPGINVYHHLEIPVLNKYRIVSHSSFFMLNKTYDITLEDQVRSNIWYEDVIKVLREAQVGDTITFHLAGFGGQEDSMFLLINNIKASKAKVIMSVEAPVYSAYAYIATSGDELIMYPYTFLMFHFSSILNTDCTQVIGTDRGVSNIEHCQALKDKDVGLGIDLVNSNVVLTSIEKTSILSGHDVYLYKSEVESRYTGLTETK